MKSFLNLLRFLAWYGVAVVTLFYVLPMVGLIIEVQYDALSSTAKFFSVIGVFAVIASWQAITLRDRFRHTTRTP